MPGAPNAESPLLIYNTMTRAKAPFEPIEPGKVGMYNCGPTVYDNFHVGNARNFICADVIRRHLAWRGLDVTFVQNITDIEDKIINRAREAGIEPSELAERFTQVFFESAGRLGVREADHHPRATKYVGKMIGLARRLEQSGNAYAADGDLYFRVERFKEYGKLSGRKVEDLKSGARVEVSAKKESPVDFVLWKAAKEGEPSWKSPWGDGRPGWHLECSVMAMDLLGETFDIHMGGNDLIFPHHENEIAQSEAATGKPFAHVWMHNGFLNVNGEKMSKSLGNFFTIDEVLDKFDPSVVRYFLLSAHYRSPLDFSDGALDESATALERLRVARQTARRLTEAANLTKDAAEKETPPEDYKTIRAAFQTAMDDDFNTPRALAVLFDCATRVNQAGNRALAAEKEGRAPDDSDAQIAFWLGRALDELGGELLGIELEAPHADLQRYRDDILSIFEEMAKEFPEAEGLSNMKAKAAEDRVEDLLNALIVARDVNRLVKFWKFSDAIRDKLAKIGFEVLDRPSGAEWKRKA